MNFKFKNVYVDASACVVGPYEAKGPLGKKFDKTHNDLYMGEDSFEKAEVKLSFESAELAIKKSNFNRNQIDLIIAGDLQNQISVSTYAASNFSIPFMGVFTACASNNQAIIMGAALISSKYINTCLCVTSSHNMSCEKQFRNPTEYGAPKPLTSTFTATGGASLVLSNKKSKIKIESATLGSIVDLNVKDALNMGEVMAGAACKTISEHLKEMKRDASYYDLIVTGDLGVYGKKIVKDFLLERYKIKLNKTYDDCGTMLYDINSQKYVHAGASGPVASALVVYSKIFDEMKKGKLKKVLVVATGALFNPIFLFQKENILSIAHAISLESV